MFFYNQKYSLSQFIDKEIQELYKVITPVHWKEKLYRVIKKKKKDLWVAKSFYI